MTKLNNDRCRCYGMFPRGIECERRERCARYLQRETGTKYVSGMCGYAENEFLDYFIECDPSDCEPQEQA